MQKTNDRSVSIRWRYLALGVVSLLFAGVIYAWSILKAPLSDAFSWSSSQLALNFTLTMCFFCIGGFVGGLLSRRIGIRWCLVLSAVLSGAGFFLSSRLNAGDLLMLYISYGVMAGLGIGIAYTVIISSVSAWFPDKKGLCSGTLMMGFGASALAVGNLAALLIDASGWRTAYLVLGAALCIVLLFTAFVLKRPDESVVLPVQTPKAASSQESFEAVDYTTGEMLRRPSFYKAFLCIVCLAAVGSTVISFARDMALSVGADAALATTLVGVLSVCNGLGRVLTGALFDRLGRKKTMLAANILSITAAGITLAAVLLRSLPLTIVGLCLIGFSYGTGPTITSALASAFYGTRNFALNFSVLNFNLMFASFMATVASRLLEVTGGYVGPFLFLLGLAVASLVLNISIRRP